MLRRAKGLTLNLRVELSAQQLSFKQQRYGLQLRAAALRSPSLMGYGCYSQGQLVAKNKSCINHQLPVQGIN